MPTYRNTKTGNVLTIPCLLSGRFWEEVTEKTEAKPEEIKPEKKASKKPKSAKKK